MFKFQTMSDSQGHLTWGFRGMKIWPGGKAPSVAAPGFIRPHLTFCEGLRNNITLDFPESPAPFRERDAHPEARLFSLPARWNAWDLLRVPGGRTNPNAGMAEI